MQVHKTILRALFKALLFPLNVIFVAFPNLLKSLIFLVLKRRIRLLRPNCVFLINPASGQLLGKRLLEILGDVHHEDFCKSLFDPDVSDFIRRHIRALPGDERLVVVVCGGDGSMSSVVTNLSKEGVDMDHCVFVPMPVGTGNDLSNSLNLGCKLSLDFLYEYFNKLNSSKCEVTKVDMWHITYRNHATGETLDRSMLLYFGIGTDGRYTRMWDYLRQRYKFLFKVNVNSPENRPFALRGRVFPLLFPDAVGRTRQKEAGARPSAGRPRGTLPEHQQLRKHNRAELSESRGRPDERVGLEAGRVVRAAGHGRWTHKTRSLR